MLKVCLNIYKLFAFIMLTVCLRCVCDYRETCPQALAFVCEEGVGTRHSKELFADIRHLWNLDKDEFKKWFRKKPDQMKALICFALSRTERVLRELEVLQHIGDLACSMLDDHTWVRPSKVRLSLV